MENNKRQTTYCTHFDIGSWDAVEACRSAVLQNDLYRQSMPTICAMMSEIRAEWVAPEVDSFYQKFLVAGTGFTGMWDHIIDASLALETAVSEKEWEWGDHLEWLDTVEEWVLVVLTADLPPSGGTLYQLQPGERDDAALRLLNLARNFLKDDGIRADGAAKSISGRGCATPIRGDDDDE